jgi:hypothetical protein
MERGRIPPLIHDLVLDRSRLASRRCLFNPGERETSHKLCNMKFHENLSGGCRGFVGVQTDGQSDFNRRYAGK